MSFDLLIIAGSLSFLAAALHIVVVFGGPGWYRRFGAGETMARLAEKGSFRPTAITLSIAFVLVSWGGYAWSGAGFFPAMPYVKWVLSVITAIYLIRGVGGLVVPFLINHPKLKQNSTTFWLSSSVLCLVIGIIHLMGILTRWHAL